MISVETPLGTVKHVMGMVKNLLHNVKLGCDFHLFWELWGERQVTSFENVSEVIDITIFPELKAELMSQF